MNAVIILAGIICGIIVSKYTSPAIVAAISFTFALIIRFVIAIIVKSKPYILLKAKYLHITWVYALFLSLGCLTVWYHTPSFSGDSRGIPNYNPGQEYQISGTILSRKTNSTSEVYEIKVNFLRDGDELIKCRNVKFVIFSSGDVIISPGSEIIYKSKLKKYNNKFRDKTQYSSFISRDKTYKKIGESRSLIILANRWRNEIGILIEKSSLSENSIAHGKALILADKGGLREGDQKFFREAGISHILAVSGLHTGILTIALLWLTAPLIFFGGRNLRYITVIIAVWFFTLLTGMNYSTVRAALMLTIAAIAWIMERQRAAFPSVCVAAIIILLIDPDALYNIGFQLSFICVGALCLFVERLNPVHHHEHPITHKISSLFLTTLVATGATWMLTAYYFDSIPLNFLIVNVIIIPLLPLYMFGMILYILLLGIGFEWHLLANGLNYATEFMIKFISIFSGNIVRLNISELSLILWFSFLATFGISLNVKSSGHNSGASINQEETQVSFTWLITSAVLFLASIISLILQN